MSLSIIFFSLFALALACILYHYLSTKRDAKKYPCLGEMVDIGGYKLHMHKSGRGDPTVILEAGLSCLSSDWALVQEELSQFTQVISYDRAGSGWSESSPFPRTSLQIVRELHALLQKAEIPPPYILVGHSFGGIHVQLFAAEYPQEVLGLVLVDSCHEAQERKLLPNPLYKQIQLVKTPWLVFILASLGIGRFLTWVYVKSMMQNLPSSIQKRHLAAGSATKHLYTMSREAKLFTESLHQLEERRAFLQKTPCWVLTAGLKPRVFQWVWKKKQAALDKLLLIWNALQADIAASFSHSCHLVAQKSDHMIPWHGVDTIVQSVRSLMGEHPLSK